MPKVGTGEYRSVSGAGMFSYATSPPSCRCLATRPVIVSGSLLLGSSPHGWRVIRTPNVVASRLQCGQPVCSPPRPLEIGPHAPNRRALMKSMLLLMAALSLHLLDRPTAPTVVALRFRRCVGLPIWEAKGAMRLREAAYGCLTRSPASMADNHGTGERSLKLQRRPHPRWSLVLRHVLAVCSKQQRGANSSPLERSRASGVGLVRRARRIEAQSPSMCSNGRQNFPFSRSSTSFGKASA
jgi:hypothetical protein